MSYTYASMFPIIVPDNLEINLRVLKVREKMPEDEKRAHMLNNWAGVLWRNTLKAPVKPFRVNSTPSLLIPDHCVHLCENLSFVDIPNIEYHLDLTDERIKVRLTENCIDKRNIVEELLKMGLTTKLRKLWKRYWRWQWNLFYRTVPDNAHIPDRLVDAYRGIKFAVVWLDNGNLYLALDVRTKYIGKRSLYDYCSSQTQEEISDHLDTSTRLASQKRPRLIRDNGLVKFSCLFAGETEQLVKDFKFIDPKDNVEKSIEDYYKNVYKLSLPVDDLAIFVKDDEKRNPIGAPSSRLFPSFNTEQIMQMHPYKIKHLRPPSAQLSPTLRMNIIENFVNEIREFDFLGDVLKLDQHPFNETRRFFQPPDLEFGNNYVLNYTQHIPKEKDKEIADEKRILKWSKAKMLTLYKFGAYYASDMPQLKLIMPANWDRQKRDYIKYQIESELKKITKRKNVILKAELYKDVLYGKDLLSNIEECSTQHLEIIIGLHKNLKNVVHDQIKQITPMGVNTQCFSDITASKIYLGSSSYLRNLALAFLIDCGVKPWVLCSNLTYDVYIGIDVLNNRTAFHFFWGEFARQMKFFPGSTSSQARHQEAIKRPLMAQYLIKGIHEIHKHTNKPISSIAIHRDGRWWQHEQRGLELARKELLKEGLITSDCRIAVIEIRKTHFPVRLLSKVTLSERDQYINPIPGVYLPLNSFESLLVCASKPLAWDSENGRTAGTIVLRIAYSDDSADIIDITRDAYFLTQLNWSAPDISINVPVTIRWADDKLRDHLLQTAELEEDIMEVAEFEEDENYEE